MGEKSCVEKEAAVLLASRTQMWKYNLEYIHRGILVPFQKLSKHIIKIEKTLYVFPQSFTFLVDQLSQTP